ncbi:MAG: PAS domain-containing sensor histidine kinase [Myxococcota bacterium]|nr:PAS domain-containing sensor histidine kinase [Myxococcota bacterium]
MPNRRDQEETAAAQTLEERYGLLERAHRHQLQILHAIGISSPDFTYVFDKHHRFIYVSPALLKLWGRTLAEAVGKNFEELGYPPNLVELHRSQLDEALTGKTVCGANSYVSPEGKEGHYEYTFVPVVSETGEVETIVGTTRDVTARVVLEGEREGVLARLTDSERQFRDFADSIPQLAWIARGDGFIFWYNRRWYEFTGTTPEQMEGWGWQQVHDPRELPRVLGRWKQCIANGDAFEMTFPLKGMDGGFRRFLTRVAPVRDDRGRIVRWFGTNTDIEEERRLLGERDAALDAAAKAISLRDEFLSIASHELRTPLAATLLQMEGAQRLIEKSQPIEKVADRLKKALAAASRIERLMTELLDVSRLSAGRLRLDPSVVDLGALVQEVCDRLDLRHPRVVSVAVDGKVVGVWDPLRLEQVVTNLVDNAIKYGKGQPVEVSVARLGGSAVFRIRDHGLGIAASEQPHLFKRFARAAGARNYRGFGLGLWITREIVEASGGRIELQSSEGEGSTFIVTLPLGGDHASESAGSDRR